MTDYYNTLGLSKTATVDQIRKAYKTLARKWHPDKNPNNKEEAEQKFKEVSEAYQVLSDPEKREKYDLYGVEGLEMPDSAFKYESPLSPDELFASFFGGGDPFAGFRNNGPFKGTQTFRDHNGTNPFASFPDIFGNSGNFKVNSPTKKNKSPSAEKDLLCTLEDLYNGKTRKLKVTRKVYTQNGVSNEELLVNVDIQPGWKEGTKVTFEGYSDQLPTMSAGDLIFTVKEKAHPIFKRVDNDLVMQCNVTLKEALEGFSKTVTLLDGKKEHFVRFPLVESTEEHVIRGVGMPIRKGGKIIGRGNMIVKFNILIDVNKSQKKKILEALN